MSSNSLYDVKNIFPVFEKVKTTSQCVRTRIAEFYSGRSRQLSGLSGDSIPDNSKIERASKSKNQRWCTGKVCPWTNAHIAYHVPLGKCTTTHLYIKSDGPFSCFRSQNVFHDESKTRVLYGL